jgi:deoxyribose-phosphate aldolase
METTPLSCEGALVAPLIDHTLLKPDSIVAQIVTLCREARCYGFASVCVNPAHVRLAAVELDGTKVSPGTVIGFPTGAVTIQTKEFQAGEAIANGARELDMVLAVGSLKDGDFAYVLRDISAVVSIAAGYCVKVIIETCLLTDSEKVTACMIAVDGGAKFVKTSTGFAGGGATVDDIRLMRKTVGPSIGVKASGGIRTLAEALRLIDAGATRIGTSAGVSIVTTG